MSLSRAKIPTIVSSSIICFLAGGALGAAGMIYLGYDTRPKQLTGGKGADPPGAEAKGGQPGGMIGGKGGMKGGGPPGGMRGGMMGGMAGPTPKTQLASLVAKLDQLTAKPLAVDLNDQQRVKLGEQLMGLAEAKDLSEEEAKKRLDAILAIVQEQKETLEAAGFRWPGGGGAGGQQPANPPNPFSEGANKEHLKKLEKRLGKDKSK